MLNALNIPKGTDAEKSAISFIKCKNKSGTANKNPKKFKIKDTNITTKNNTYVMLNIGNTNIFVKTPSKLTFWKVFKHTGIITKLVATLTARPLAKNSGIFIFFKILVKKGAKAIIENIHKKDNWNEVVNNERGLTSKIITPAILRLLMPSYSICNTSHSAKSIDIMLALDTLGVKLHRYA